MALETGTYLNDLVATNPDGATDAKSDGDNHIRLIKSTLKATFPGMAGAAWRVQTKATNYALAATDNMTQINVTAAATISGTAATLGNGFMVLLYNSSLTNLVVLPGGHVLYPDEGCLLTCDASAFSHFFTRRHGFMLVNVQTAVTASGITLTGMSHSTFKEYRIVLQGITLSQDAAINMRLGNGSIDTGSSYNWNYIQSNGTTVTTANSGLTNAIQIIPSVESTNNIISVDIGVGANATVRQNYSSKVGFTSSVDGSWNQYLMEGYYNGQTDRAIVYPTAGTFSGVVALYGLR